MKILQIEIDELLVETLLADGTITAADFIVTNYFDVEETAESRAKLLEAVDIERQARKMYADAMKKSSDLREAATNARRNEP